MSEQRPEFGRAVADLLARHGISQNMASIRAVVDRFTIGRMMAGIPPRLDILEKFARAFGEDVNRWRVLAGYPPIEPEWSAAEAWTVGLKEISAEVGRPLRLSDEVIPGTEWTPEQVKKALEIVREAVAEYSTHDPGGTIGGGSEGTARPRRRPRGNGAAGAAAAVLASV